MLFCTRNFLVRKEKAADLSEDELFDDQSYGDRKSQAAHDCDCGNYELHRASLVKRNVELAVIVIDVGAAGPLGTTGLTML